MVEIIPRPVTKLPRWINILFYLSFVILIVIILSYFVLTNFLEKYQENIKVLEEQLQKEEAPENISMGKEVSRLGKKIEDFSALINQHIISSNFFVFLEKLTYPKIWFSQLNLNSKEGKVVLYGRADSFATLGYQLQILFKEPLIKNISLDQISIAKTGEVDFSLNLTLDPLMFKW